MPVSNARTDDYLGLLDGVKKTIRDRIKEGSLKDGDLVDIVKLAPDSSKEHIEALVVELRPYKGMVLGLGEIHEQLPPKTTYTFTHGSSASLLVLHIHTP